MPRNHDITELRRLDVAHHLPAQADWAEIEKLGGSRIITHAEGCTIVDGEGHRILDGMAGLWCVNVGYGREELVEAAAAQMRELPFYNTFFKTATPPTVTLAAKIAQLTGGRLPHIFFNASGSEANDTVFRMVRHYWKLKGEPKQAMHAQGDLPIPGVEHVRQPYFYGEGQGMTEEEFCDACVAAIEDKILEVGPENCAAFIGEPVQGAGGVIIPPKGYWPKVEAVVRKYGLLLVADEVICGFGRTGKMWGHETMGFTPDLMPMAKGLSSGYLPISATAVASHVVDVLKTGGDFVHGFTYSGHPVAAAVALKNIEIIEREGLVERTGSVTGPHLAKALATLDDHPLVGETRSIGLLGAVEIVADKETRARFGGAEGTAGPMARDACIANGLMVRGIRDSLVMCPPLVITTEQIDEMVAIIRKSLDEVMPKLRAL